MQAEYSEKKGVDSISRVMEVLDQESVLVAAKLDNRPAELIEFMQALQESARLV